MFIYNINDRIKNGVHGTIVSFADGLPVVSCKVIGTRSQIPLLLSWAMTVHKAQGQTLHAVEVYCGKHFAPGHLYLALSRVRSSSRLRVVSFDCKNLIPPSNKVLHFLDNLVAVPADEQSNCCHVMTLMLDDKDFTIASDEELTEGD